MSTPGGETPGVDAVARADAGGGATVVRRAGGPRPGWGERAGQTLTVVGPLAFLAVFFAWPVTTFMGCGLASDGALDLSGFSEVLAREHTWWVLTQTLTQAVLGTAVCMALGIPGAPVLRRRAFPGRGLLRGMVTVPLVLPSVVVGVAFHALVTRGGPLEALDLDGTLTAVVAALAFFNYRLVVRTVGTMQPRLDPRAAETTRALGASPMRAFATVTLPALAPAIASAASLTFLFCATACGVVLVLGGVGTGTIEIEIYRLTTQYLDLRGATVLSAVQFGAIALALWVAEQACAATQTRLRLRTEMSASRLRAADTPALAVTATTVGGLLTTPMAVLVARSLQRDGAWTLTNYTGLGSTNGCSALLVTTWEAAANSVTVAVAAAAIALSLGVAVCLVVSRRLCSRALARIIIGLDAAFMLSLGASTVTVGFGFLITLVRPPLALTRSWWILPLAQAIVAVPLAVRTLLPALRTIGPRQCEAAAVLRAGPGRVLAAVDGPQLLCAGGLAAGFALTTLLGEFRATSFLARPQELTPPVVVYRLIGSSDSQNQGMALAGGVVLAVGSAAVMLGCEWLQTRFSPGRGGGAGATLRPGGASTPQPAPQRVASADVGQHTAGATGESNKAARVRGPRTDGGERP